VIFYIDVKRARVPLEGTGASAAARRCELTKARRSAVASPESGARVRAELSYMKLFVTHRMTRNNTLDKVHVAATELS